jgi:betaine-aldehyde dehydrogenase
MKRAFIGASRKNIEQYYQFLDNHIPPQLSSFVDGEVVGVALHRKSPPHNTFIVEDASRGTTISTIYEATEDTVEDAIDSAHEAQQDWATNYTVLDRARILRRAAHLLRENKEKFALLESVDTARPLQETFSDVASGYNCLEYMSGLAVTGLNGHHVPLDRANWGYVQKEPIGVCVGIGAWNYPLQSAVWKSAPALAAGNSIVLKPAPETPLTALELAKIYMKAGVPRGCVNVVLGRDRVGHALTTSPIVGKISFTGSKETGAKVYANAAQTMKRVTMELGGKSPLIIFDDCLFDDCNMVDAVSAAMMANWYSNGEVCSNGTRVFVHENIKEEFLHLLIERTRKLKIGNPMHMKTEMGPLISQRQYDKVLQYIKTGVEEGATILTGGNRDTIALKDEFKNGYYLQPTIFDNCQDDMKIVREEIFGPVMSILTFSTEDEVVERANQTPYGLSAGIFTNDIRRAHRTAQRVEAGSVWINNYNLSPVELPWLGHKQSGLGYENGPLCLSQWTRDKSVYVEMGRIDCPYE